jgi:spermidine/putrescine transport system ATP-binding protein
LIGLMDHTDDSELLRVADARKAFRTPEAGTVTALSGVNLSIRKNEFLTLLGPSGCGKTTLLKTIAGFEDLDDGEIYLEGRAMSAVPAHRRPFNTVFQNYALFPHMTVAENIGYGLEIAGVARQERVVRVTEALRLVSLAGLERRKPSQLSGGQQQRVALARALINRPRVLLLDEPLSALDRRLRQSMEIELKSLQHTVGITFLFVTHDQEEALTMSDRTAVMDRGRILQLGTPAEIYDTPANRFVASFIGTSNILTGKLALDRHGGVVKVDGGTEIHVAEHGFADGDLVDVVLRPEHLSVAAPGAHSPCQLDVTLENVVFVGSDLHLHGRLTNGKPIIALHRHARGSSNVAFNPGQVVSLHYAASAPHLMTSAGQ